MNIQDAANLLDLEGEIKPETIKQAYRRAAMKFHPDRNPAGLHMMQAINAAYALLENFTGSVERGNGYDNILSAAINAVLHCPNVNIEVCGNWVWLSGDTRTHKDIISNAGFKYSGTKKMWYYRPEEWKSANRKKNTMNKIREVYGSVKVPTQQAECLS